MAKQSSEFYNLVGNSDGKTLNLSINDDIGDFFAGTTADDFSRALNDKEITTIDIDINTNGGIVHEGIAIFNMLKNHPATVKTNVIGQAASIGTVIFAAGDERTMDIGASLFFHPIRMSMGGSFLEGELRELADEIPKLESGVIDIIHSASNSTREEISNIMGKETRITDQEALDMGLATEISSSIATNLKEYNKTEAVNYKKDKEKIQQVLNDSNKILNNNKPNKGKNVMEKNEFDKRLAEFEGKLTTQMNEMKTLKTDLEKSTTMVNTYRDEVKTLEGTIVEMNDKAVSSEFTNYVESLIVQCKVTPDEKKEIIANLEYRNKDSIEMLNSYKDLLNSRKPKFSLQKDFTNNGNGTENVLGDGVALTDEEKATKKKIMLQAVKRKGVR